MGRIEFNAERQRWTLLHADGSLSNWFARDADRAAVVATLTEHGIVTHDDDTCHAVARS